MSQPPHPNTPGQHGPYRPQGPRSPQRPHMQPGMAPSNQRRTPPPAQRPRNTALRVVLAIVGVLIILAIIVGIVVWRMFFVNPLSVSQLDEGQCIELVDDGKEPDEKSAGYELVDCDQQVLHYEVIQVGEDIECATNLTPFMQAKGAYFATACLFPVLQQGSCYKSGDVGPVSEIACTDPSATIKVESILEGDGQSQCTIPEAAAYYPEPGITYCLVGPRAG